MDRKEIVDSYFSAWNQSNLPDLLSLLHPQASYYDAFWGETCSGRDLSKYFDVNINLEPRWYRPDGEIVVTPNGMAVRYLAFNRDDVRGLNPVFNGVEVFTLSGALIMTISDYYCDSSTSNLIAIAALAEGRHGRANTVHRGLGAKSASRIEQRLARLAKEHLVLIDPSLTVTKLADAVGCSVMHLFHVLEDKKKTTFIEFVNESRARYASTLLVDTPNIDIHFAEVAQKSGFESITDFRQAFETTFGVSPDDYMERFAT